MLVLLLVQIGSSMPIYGNFSQYYYYVELNNKNWILDQAFDGAIEDRECLDSNNSKSQFFFAQRFIQIRSLPLSEKMINQADSANYICQDTCKMQLGDFTVNNYCGQYYNYYQEINNYLGLGQIVQNPNSDQQLKLCLAQNGGYMKIGNFEKDEQHIKIDYVQLDCFMESNCQKNRLKFIGLEIKQLFIYPQSLIEVVVDFTNTYVELPSYMYLPLIQQIQCQGVFCPKRNDSEGLICYDNDYDNVEKFYQKFPNIRFYFYVSSKFFWFPQDYLVTHDNKTYCFPVRGGTSKIILGQPFMRNKEFIFGKEKLIVNYQNCSEETSLDAPTISLYIEKEISKFYIGISLLISTFIIYYILLKFKQRKANQQLINPHIQ
ncbi:unnamed protein product [Paramecium octaurelia]|uniref:Xylanase inhibitor C-terminal domain-containing protein n=1 Tax=Paramecium octaurelia TaxID=43137 RepID=A0A8S1RZ46_PAROT|nr:unnamed protein product [Paramecium octaurelia]